MYNGQAIHNNEEQLPESCQCDIDADDDNNSTDLDCGMAMPFPYNFDDNGTRINATYDSENNVYLKVNYHFLK